MHLNSPPQLTLQDLLRAHVLQVVQEGKEGQWLTIVGLPLVQTPAAQQQDNHKRQYYKCKLFRCTNCKHHMPSPSLSLSHSIIHSHLNKHYGAQIAQLVEHPFEKPGTLTTWVQVPSAARDLSPSHLPGQTFLWCPYSPHVQPHASTSVCMSKDPEHWQRYHCLDTQNTTHADRNW